MLVLVLGTWMIQKLEQALTDPCTQIGRDWDLFTRICYQDIPVLEEVLKSVYFKEPQGLKTRYGAKTIQR